LKKNINFFKKNLKIAGNKNDSAQIAIRTGITINRLILKATMYDEDY